MIQSQQASSAEHPRDWPLVFELSPFPDPANLFARLSHLPHTLFLDSARRDSPLGRYSYVAVDPFAVLRETVDTPQPLSTLRQVLSQFVSPTLPQLPPFQGGAAGLWSYDLNRSLERLPRPRYDEFGVPALAVGLYDTVIAWDHASHRAWIVSQGWPELEPARRLLRAESRCRQLLNWIENSPAQSRDASIRHRRELTRSTHLELADLCPQHAVVPDLQVTSNFDRSGYLTAISAVLDYIRAGDAFQINLAQRLLRPADEDPVSLYLRLRQRNPAPFAGYFDLGDFQILSASPERFLQVNQRQVEARPIKGTRLRRNSPEADLFTGDELRLSEKDRAENIMIVDLLRNDLARVCRPDSIRVTQLCGLEAYEYVQHLVSVVRGTLSDSASTVDVVAGAFPGGSVTGAPKIRAMEIIAELEPTARGPYCGCLGYWGFDGALDSNILIRTITAGRGWWQFPVGGGIVVQSSPPDEYAETWHKAEGLLRSLVR